MIPTQNRYWRDIFVSCLVMHLMRLCLFYASYHRKASWRVIVFYEMRLPSAEQLAAGVVWLFAVRENVNCRNRPAHPRPLVGDFGRHGLSSQPSITMVGDCWWGAIIASGDTEIANRVAGSIEAVMAVRQSISEELKAVAYQFLFSGRVHFFCLPASIGASHRPFIALTIDDSDIVSTRPAMRQKWRRVVSRPRRKWLRQC